MKFNIEFSGGLELLFNKQKKLQLEVEPKDNFTVHDLIQSLKLKIVEKSDFFLNKDNQM